MIFAIRLKRKKEARKKQLSVRLGKKVQISKESWLKWKKLPPFKNKFVRENFYPSLGV